MNLAVLTMYFTWRRDRCITILILNKTSKLQSIPTIFTMVITGLNGRIKGLNFKGLHRLRYWMWQLFNGVCAFRPDKIKETGRNNEVRPRGDHKAWFHCTSQIQIYLMQKVSRLVDYFLCYSYVSLCRLDSSSLSEDSINKNTCRMKISARLLFLIRM